MIETQKGGRIARGHSYGGGKIDLQHPGCVAALLTTVNEAFDRVAMHAVRRALLEAQAEAAGLPLHAIGLPWPCPNEAYEARMAEAVAQSMDATTVPPSRIREASMPIASS